MRLDDLISAGKTLRVMGRYEGGCGVCPRKLKHHVVPLLHDAPIIVVGETPTQGEADNGAYLSTSSGQYLQEQFRQAGIPDFAYTCVTKCRTPNKTGPGDKEISCCMSHHTIPEVTGYSIVVLLGRAAQAFFPGTRAKTLRGNLAYHPDFPGQRFYTLHNPAWVFHDKAENEPVYKKLIQRLGRIVQEDGAVNWRMVTGDAPDFTAQLAKALESTYVSFDLETTTVRSWEPGAAIDSFAVYTGEDAVISAFKEDAGFETGLDMLVEFMNDPTKVLLGQNVGFDCEFMERHRGAITRCRIADTQMLFYQVYNLKMAGLKSLASEYEDGYRHLLIRPDLYWGDDKERLIAYNAEDVVLTYNLFRRYYPLLRPLAQDLFWNVAAPSGLALQRCTTAGFNYDIDYAHTLQAEIEGDIEADIARWKEIDPDFRPHHDMSGHGLLKYMFTTHGLPILGRTESGQPSTDADVLKKIKLARPGVEWLDYLLSIRKNQKLLSTYVEKYVNGTLIGTDGRVHSSFTNANTTTGRSSSYSPNAQNIPRDPRIRRAFIPSDGNVLMQGDFSQFELRIAMCLAEDPIGIHAYQSGSDLHQQTANAIAARAGREVATKEDRSNAKPVNFAWIYGGDIGTLIRYALSTYGVVYTKKEAQEYYETFFGTYKMLHPWHASVISTLRAQQGWLESVLGHTWYYDAWMDENQGLREHHERSAINMTCQSPAGYLTLGALHLAQQLAFERGLPVQDETVRFVSSVHDSIMVDTPAEFVPELKQCMLDAVDVLYDWIKPWFVVPLVMDFEIGPSWGDLKGDD